MAEVICLGELLVDFCATATDVGVAEAPGFTKAPGGAPANVAVAVQRLGVRAGFVGAVGCDPFGKFLAEVLVREGVETTGLVQLEEVKTPLAFVAVHSDGSGDFFFYHDAGLAPLREEHIDADYIAAAAALHFGAISRIHPQARDATDKARRIARDHGLLVGYDPNYRPRLWADPDEARQRIREGFLGTTVAKVSAEEWAFILGTDEFDRGAAELLEMGVELVVRSEGPGGASFATARCRGHVDAFPVRAVEFTGAGDAFMGAILAETVKLGTAGASLGELSEAELRRIVRRANAAGALATTRPGAIPALPSREELDAFLANRGRP